MVLSSVRSVGFRPPVSVKLLLNKTLARCNAEYSSQVWSPYLKHDILRIESVQRSMTRFILNDDQSYSERCVTLRILPFSYRREVADLIFVFKILHGMFDVDFSPEISLADFNHSLRSRWDNSLLVEPIPELNISSLLF